MDRDEDATHCHDGNTFRADEGGDAALSRTTRVRVTLGGALLALRRKLGPWPGLPQAAFAKRFGLSLGMVKDVEQGRTKPSRPLRVLMVAIELDPALVERAAGIAQERWGPR